jgi:hypothetical protein
MNIKVNFRPQRRITQAELDAFVEKASTKSSKEANRL